MVIDRDTKRPEVFRLTGSRYVLVAPDTEGWLGSETLGIRLACREGALCLASATGPALEASI